MLDALVVTSLPNVLYLSNFTGSAAIVVLTKEAVHFITDATNEFQTRTIVGKFQ